MGDALEVKKQQEELLKEKYALKIQNLKNSHDKKCEQILKECEMQHVIKESEMQRKVELLKFSKDKEIDDLKRCFEEAEKEIESTKLIMNTKVIQMEKKIREKEKQFFSEKKIFQ